MSEPFDMPNSAAPWEMRGGWVVNRMMADLDLLRNGAAGFVGNFGMESLGFTKLQEIRPAVPGSRGGFGWPQWTGDRRTAYERWCADQDLDSASDRANYGYVVEELRTTHAHSLAQVKKTTTLEAAVFTAGYFYEHPGGTTTTHLPGYEERLHWGQRALAGSVGLLAPASSPPLPIPLPATLPAPPEAAPPRQMSGAQGAVIGGLFTLPLATVLQWVTHWPWQALDNNTALSLAVLILGVVSLIVHQFGRDPAEFDRALEGK